MNPKPKGLPLFLCISLFLCGCNGISTDERLKPLTLAEIKEEKCIANRSLPSDGKRANDMIDRNASRWLQENGRCLVVWYSSGYFSSGLCLVQSPLRNDLKTTVTAFLETQHSPCAFGYVRHFTRSGYADEHGNPQIREIGEGDWHSENAERKVNAGDVIVIEGIL